MTAHSDGDLFPHDIFDLAGKVRSVAKEHPSRIAIIEPSGRDGDGKRRYTRYTYEALSNDAESVALGLREMGIAEGTRTVFMAPPSYEGCVVYLALTRVGATVIMIDPAVGLQNVGERLRRLRPEAFVGIPLAHVARAIFGWGPRFIDKAIVVGQDAILPRDRFPAWLSAASAHTRESWIGEFLKGRSLIPGARTVASLRRPAPRLEDGVAIGGEPQRAAITPDDPMTVLYTTGSTGPAKPALYTHRNFCGVFRIVRHSWGFDRSTELPIDMAVFPAFFIVGLSAGGTVVVPPIHFVSEPPAKTDPAPLVEVINDCGVRSLFASPIILENMALYSEAQGIKMPSLKVIIGGGAPITGPVMGALTRAMPKGEVYSNYGCTEALPSTFHSAQETLAETWALTEAGHGICVGRPFPGVDVKIQRIVDGVATELDILPGAAFGSVSPEAQIGEVIAKSPHISARYFDDRESTLKNKIFLESGESWHRIGDAGYMDEKGRIWVVGRVGHRVRGPKGPLFPLLCEPIFNAHPDILRTGLVGVPTPQGHERPVLCVELQPGRAIDRDALREALLERARAHAVSAQIEDILFMDKLPVDPRHNSKIARPALAQWAAKTLS